jgi:hypothetical protein
MDTQSDSLPAPATGGQGSSDTVGTPVSFFLTLGLFLACPFPYLFVCEIVKEQSEFLCCVLYA